MMPSLKSGMLEWVSQCIPYMGMRGSAHLLIFRFLEIISALVGRIILCMFGRAILLIVRLVILLW